MKKTLLLTFFYCVTALVVNAQENETLAVRAAINQLFDGMRANDSLLIKAVLTENTTLHTVVQDKTNEHLLEKTDINAFIKAVGTKRPEVQLDERLSGYDIKIDGGMAMAWTPYSFYVNDKFSHCGVNVFTLMKTRTGWKITAITDTRRKANCE